jgi:hypothetical protein
MAFLRFTRDKRGYEHFYLVQPITNRRGKVRTRILYWFRTPPNVKVGRQPFDESLRRALEAQNPGVSFDWQKIIETPIPSADAEKWRERRRMERAERAARQMESEDEETSDVPVEVPAPVEELATGEGEGEGAAAVDADVEAADGPRAEPVEVRPASPEDPQRRRRRRRGRRGPVPPPPREPHEPQ